MYTTWGGGSGSGGSEIVNDNVTYFALMIVGSDQLQGYGRWIRMWDSLWVAGRVDSPIYYDSNNTGYYADPAGTSNFNEVQAAGWFRPTGSGGMYWNAYGSRIFSDSVSYVKVGSGNGMVFYDAGGTILRGYVYNDGGSNFGLLGSSGGWAVRIPNGTSDVYLHGSAITYNTSYFGSAGTYYVNNGGTTRVAGITAGSLTIDGGGGIVPNVDAAATRFVGTSTARWHNMHSVYFYGASVAGPDLAEKYPASERVEPGDVVAFDPDPPSHLRVFDQSAVTSDGTQVAGNKTPVAIEKTRRPYQKGVIGVIATLPGVRLQDPNDNDSPPVAMVGRVPVKVTTENGPIKIGDYLTSSSRAGYAMKATQPGPIVGIALQALDAGEGKVLCFLQIDGKDDSGKIREIESESRKLREENGKLKERLDRLEQLFESGR